MEKLSLKQILANKEEVIRLKKSATKFCDVVNFAVQKDHTDKAKIENKEDTDDVIYKTIVANTYNWMDSHDDVHIKGIFTKSIKENSNNIMHLHDHLYQLSAKVGKVINISEQELTLKDLGVNKIGSTTSLILESAVSKEYNKQIFTMYKMNEINQHSVGMVYVNILLCVNDRNEKDEYKNWNKYFPMVINSEKALEQGYFFAVTEAKLKEVSCVIAGSNELTPTIQPLKSIEEVEPTEVVKAIDYNYLINNFKL
jgi:hypothetical protein